MCKKIIKIYFPSPLDGVMPSAISVAMSHKNWLMRQLTRSVCHGPPRGPQCVQARSRDEPEIIIYHLLFTLTYTPVRLISPFHPPPTHPKNEIFGLENGEIVTVNCFLFSSFFFFSLISCLLDSLCVVWIFKF